MNNISSLTAFKGYETGYPFMSLHVSKRGNFYTYDELPGRTIYESNSGCNCVKQVIQNPFQPYKTVCCYRADMSPSFADVNIHGDVSWFIPVNYNTDDEKETIECNRNAFYISWPSDPHGALWPIVYIMRMDSVRNSQNCIISLMNSKNDEELFEAWSLFEDTCTYKAKLILSDSDGELELRIVIPEDYGHLSMKDFKVLCNIFTAYGFGIDVKEFLNKYFDEYSDDSWVEISEEVLNDYFKLPNGYWFVTRGGELIKPVKFYADGIKYFIRRSMINHYDLSEHDGIVVFINNRNPDGIEYNTLIAHKNGNYSEFHGYFSNDELFDPEFNFNEYLSKETGTDESNYIRRNWESYAVYLD